jgi:hypothetical protein
MPEEQGEQPAEFVYINLHLEMRSFHGAEADEYVKVPRAEWEAMDDDARQQYMANDLDEFLANHVDAGWGEVDTSARSR